MSKKVNATIATTEKYTTLTFAGFHKMKPLVTELNRRNDGSWDFNVIWNEMIIESSQPEVSAFLFAAMWQARRTEYEVEVDERTQQYIDTVSAAISDRTWTLS